MTTNKLQIEAIDRIFSVGENGEILRFIVNIPEIKDFSAKYKSALLQIRGLPQRIESVVSEDPLVAWAIDHARKCGATMAKDEEADWALDRAIAIYQEYDNVTSAHGFLLAAFSHVDNNKELDKEPLPYTEEDYKEPEPLPGLEMYITPVLRYNLAQKLERRLKRLSDIFDKYKEHDLAIQADIKRLGAYIYGRVIETDSFRKDAEPISSTGNGTTRATRKKS